MAWNRGGDGAELRAAFSACQRLLHSGRGTMIASWVASGRQHLLVAGLGPLPDADRRPQILAGVLGIVGPIEIGEFDAAAVDQRTLRQVEFQRDLAQFVRLDRSWPSAALR